MRTYIFAVLVAAAVTALFYGQNGGERALAHEATDEETGSSYYVYGDGAPDVDGPLAGSEDPVAGDGGVFRFDNGGENSKDDILLDEAIASKMNLDESGNPIALRLLSGNPQRKEVALTFDDGPHPEYTSRILSILQFYRVRATFFMVGYQANRFPHWVKQVSQLGNEVGDHTYDHFRLTKLPPDEIAYQIRQTQEVIFQITGRYPRFIRPPGGRYDQPILQEFAASKVAVALWTYNTKDVDVSDPELIYKGVMDNLKNGSIILMHDGSDATIKALPRIIEGIKSKGYRLVTLGEMVENLGSGTAQSESNPQETGYDEWKIRGQG